MVYWCIGRIDRVCAVMARSLTRSPVVGWFNVNNILIVSSNGNVVAADPAAPPAPVVVPAAPAAVIAPPAAVIAPPAAVGFELFAFALLLLGLPLLLLLVTAAVSRSNDFNKTSRAARPIWVCAVLLLWSQTDS